MQSVSIFQDIQMALQRGEQIAIATVVKTSGSAPCTPGHKLLVYSDGTTKGKLAGPQTDQQVVAASLNALRQGQSQLIHVHIDADQGESVGSCGATLEIFCEVLRPEPRLVIAGAGYVAQALANLATRLHFQIDVVDDRRDLANPAHFSENIQLNFGDIPQTIQALKPDNATSIVIVTRGHTSDKEALRAALTTPAVYIGMIGSTGKVKQIFRTLQQEGIALEQLERVHAPIGLDIGAETPDEIALSIAAELVMIRHHGSGASLKSIHHLLPDESQAISSEKTASELS